MRLVHPTRKQAAVLQFTLDRNRELYNAALEERREAWRMSRVSVTYNMQSAQLPQIKEIRPEYNEIYSQILQDTLKRVSPSMKSTQGKPARCVVLVAKKVSTKISV